MCLSNGLIQAQCVVFLLVQSSCLIFYFLLCVIELKKETHEMTQQLNLTHCDKICFTLPVHQDDILQLHCNMVPLFVWMGFSFLLYFSFELSDWRPVCGMKFYLSTDLTYFGHTSSIFSLHLGNFHQARGLTQGRMQFAFI